MILETENLLVYEITITAFLPGYINGSVYFKYFEHRTMKLLSFVIDRKHLTITTNRSNKPYEEEIKNILRNIIKF